MQPKYWAITLLATAAICAGAIYYIRQPAPDLGPIVVHHVVKTAPAPASITASSTEADMSGWKIYSNSQYGFSFEYPNDWSVQIENDSLEQYEIKASNFASYQDMGDYMENVSSFTVEILPSNLSLSDWFKANFNNANGADYRDQTNLEVNGLTAIEIEDQEASGVQTMYFIKVNSDIVELVFPYDQEKFSQTYNSIVSTFQFTSPTPTPTTQPQSAAANISYISYKDSWFSIKIPSAFQATSTDSSNAGGPEHIVTFSLSPNGPVPLNQVLIIEVYTVSQWNNLLAASPPALITETKQYAYVGAWPNDAIDESLLQPYGFTNDSLYNEDLKATATLKPLR